MKKEEGWYMYTQIHELLRLGLNKSQIARHLNISRPTLYAYINMNPGNFEKRLHEMQHRSKKPDKYHNEILDWLMEFPDLSSAQIYDWLQEKYKSEVDFIESTLRNFVRNLRKEYNIPKTSVRRQYEAVVDPPMGKQMQVDFGEIWVYKPDKIKIKLYVMCFILSHSRQKYCEWQDRPFNTSDIIKIHENAFSYYGGIPEEIVYDQDHLILVSENYGDLVYTHQFATYLQQRKFRTYMCRRSDPESKGKIENTVGYVKKNFAHSRTFYNLARWNEDALAWLERRGNGKIHGTTKKIPTEVFQEERKYLRPVPEKITTKPLTLSITYQVRKDNTVPIKGNRYTVPTGTYQGTETYVKVRKIGDEYVITHLENDIELARHKVASGKGELVKNSDHSRQKSMKIPVLMSEIVDKFPGWTDEFTAFLEQIKQTKPRYIKDQLLLIQTTITDQDAAVLKNALDFCNKNQLFSAVDFRDAVNHFSKESHVPAVEAQAEIANLTPESRDKIKARPQVRDIAELCFSYPRCSSISASNSSCNVSWNSAFSFS